MIFALLLALVSWISVIPFPTRAQDGGRELSFPAYYFFAEKRLVNHTIISVPVKDLDECEYRCYLIANCVSLNIKNKDPTSGTHECELNNSTHLEDDGDLKDNQLYYYRGAENHCGKNQKKCQNSATCLSGFTSKKYRCVCNPGFEGEHCEHVDVCRTYEVLNSPDRKDTYTGKNLCDNKLKKGWYRFEGDAGTRMPTTCVEKGKCGTTFPGWLKGAHPTVEDGEVGSIVCFGDFSDCCRDRKQIRVKNCSTYYVYKLGGTPGCDMRYCGTDSP